jgi:ABC-type multidrug transport system fused ATPase/permease subunit
MADLRSATATIRRQTARLFTALRSPQAVPEGKPTMGTVVWPLMRDYRWYLIVATVMGGVHGIAITFQTVAPKYLLDDVLDWNLAPEVRHRRLLWLCSGYLLSTLVLRMFMWHAGFRIFTWVRERVVLALRAQFFRRVNHLCLRFHGQHPSGELYSYLFGSPLNLIIQFYGHASAHGPGAVCTLISTLVLCAAWDTTLTGILVVTLLVSGLIMAHSRQRVAELHRHFQEAEGDVSGKVSDLLRGNRAVKLYVMEEEVASSFEREAHRIGTKSYERDVYSHMEAMKQEGVFYVSFAVMMAACAWRWEIGRLSNGEAFAFLLSFISLLGPVSFIYTAVTLWGGAQTSIQRIGTVLQQASSTPDPVGTEHMVPPAGELELRDVSFAYEHFPTISDVSLRIPYGQKIAFVGPSGAGKSTISQLLLRLYDPQQGSIQLAGVDLRRMLGKELRKRFGVVPQDPFIFRSTIRDNVRVAKPTAKDAEIRRACELANAWEFIDKLPQGLSTRVGEGGSSLSGGQRQRLAIARVLLADPPFFIFDEATSALDTLSEELIQKALERNLAGRTSIFIAHRLATVKNVDRIVVMQAGRVVQDGSYQALVSQPGLFRELVEGQQLRG